MMPAKRILAQHLTDMIEEKYFESDKPKILFEEAADAFLPYSRVRKKSFRQDGYYVAKLKAFFGGKPLASLNMDQVEV